MKKLLVLSLLLFGCRPESPTENKGQTTKYGDFVIQEIDSCQYIVYDYGVFDQRVYAITHKGNCKYCIERNKLNK